MAGNDRVWRHLGWFSGLICAGSVVGTAAWVVSIQQNNFFFQSVFQSQGYTSRQHYVLDASSFRFNAIFLALYPVEFLCLIVPKLMLLSRLADNAIRSQVHAPDGRITRLLDRVFRSIAAVVVICSVGCMVAWDVAAVNNVESAQLYDQAADACDAQGNDTNASLAIFSQVANGNYITANTAVSVQNMLEAVALLIISFAYLVLVPLSIVLFRRAENQSSIMLHGMEKQAEHSVVQLPADYAAPGYQGAPDALIELPKGEAKAVMELTQAAAANQRRRFVAACVIVQVTFFARVAFDVLQAYSSFDNPMNPACGACDPCQTDRFLIETWLGYTPEFQPIVVCLSSPLPLAISLWLMMTTEERALLLHPNDGTEENSENSEMDRALAARQRMGVDLNHT